MNDFNQIEQDELANRIAVLGMGRPAGMLLNACLNVVVECILLRRDTRSAAEAEFDQLVGVVKAELMSRYDRTTGKPKIVILRQ